MTEDEAAAALVSQVQSAWPSLAVTSPMPPIALQNDSSFQKPINDSDGTPLPWVYLEVDFTPVPTTPGPDVGQVSIGATGQNLIRKWGLVVAYVFVPMGSGDTLCRQLGAAFIGLLQNQQFGGVTCRAGYLRGGDSNADDGAYYGRSAAVQFYFDDEG